MKTQFIALSLALASIVSISALANQATDAIRGGVTCTAESGSFGVKISPNRKLLLLFKKGHASKVFHVSVTNGDTDTWYTAEGGYPELHFSDQGDFIQLSASQNGVSLVCPQGKND